MVTEVKEKPSGRAYSIRVRVGEVYRFNAASRRLFASLGFREEAETEKGSSYVLPLREE